MNDSTSPSTYARHVVDLHTQGIICAGEVYGQFIAHATRATFRDFMAQLTPDLDAYFESTVVSHDKNTCSTKESRLFHEWLTSYYDAKNA